MKPRAPLASLVVLSLGQTLLPGQRPPALPAVPAFGLESGAALHIGREVDPERPFSVIGPRGALLGRQDGSFEAWLFPWKIFSHIRIRAEMQNYPVPIDVNQYAALIDVTPGATVLTYSHANFTIRQIMFAPRQPQQGSGVVVLYQIEAIRPMTLTFSLTPEMQRMWPAPSDPQPSPEWVPTQTGSGNTSSGFYVLHENFPDHAAALAMATAEPGILPPYQERPQVWPLEFVLHFDPARDANTVFPLLITRADTQQGTTREALAHSLAGLDAAIPTLYADNAAYFRDLLANHVSIETPDSDLNGAFSWAIAAIDQLRVETPERDGMALTAGFVGSGDSTRPGFGWFFGRDALWTLYAVNSYGDFATSRQEIDFLLAHQRADGKIMHEYAQTANLVDWQSLPYEYAAADSTPLLLMAVNDYLKISGDADFVRSHWDALNRAWTFETSHVSNDGIYNNSQGTGWVENWFPSLPYQEIYLASLDEQASLAFTNLARASGHADAANEASARAARIKPAIEKEYFQAGSGFYAFSVDAHGVPDNTPSIFPAVAWWDGSFALDHPEGMMQRWASSEFSTDWGTRDISDQVSFYDPISYHQGTVWPLYTGWVSLAEYRAGRPLSGYAHLKQNADLSWSQDLGSVTELLSGQFFQALGRSTAHQLWSSAMVISPVLRGLFGLEWSAATQTLTVNPHLPADWNRATVRRIPLGTLTVDLTFTRQGQKLLIEAGGPGASAVHLATGDAGARLSGSRLEIPLPAVEIALSQRLPEFGAKTEQLKVLDEQRGSRSLTVILSAPASSSHTILLRTNAPGTQVTAAHAVIGAERDGLRPVTLTFPTGAGYATQSVTFTW
jgi:glycogen debranching enzyme